MRWANQELGVDAEAALPGLARLNNLVRTVTTPEFDGIVFHEVLAKSALNHVSGASKVSCLPISSSADTPASMRSGKPSA